MKILSKILCLFLIAQTAYAGKIIYPWRATSVITLKGETFEVWLDADDGQTVTSVELVSPLLTLPVEFTSQDGDWEYDNVSGNRYNTSLTVTVPETAPAERFDLVLKTSTGDLVSPAASRMATSITSLVPF